MPALRTEKEVRGFLGRLNYIARFISHLCEPIFKLLKKDQVVEWNDDCQDAFDKIKEYLLEPLILMPPVEGRPLIMYLTVLDNSMGCVLGQHDESVRKEHAIYYLSKKFTDCETRYSLLEKTCWPFQVFDLPGVQIFHFYPLFLPEPFWFAGKPLFFPRQST